MESQSPFRSPIARDGFGYPVSSDPRLALGAFKDTASLKAFIEEGKDRPKGAGPDEQAAEDKQMLARAKEREAERRRRQEHLRLDHAGLIVRVEQAGLYDRARYGSADEYLEDCGWGWPGDPIGLPMKRKYLSIAEYLPDAAARSPYYGLGVKASVARLHSESCIASLAQEIEDGEESAAAIRCAAKAARIALGKGRSDKRVRNTVSKALKKGPVNQKDRQHKKELKALHKAHAVQIQVTVESVGRQFLSFAETTTRQNQTFCQTMMEQMFLALRPGTGIAEAVQQAAQGRQAQAVQQPPAPPRPREERKIPRKGPKNPVAEPVPPSAKGPVPGPAREPTPATAESAVRPAQARSGEPSAEPLPEGDTQEVYDQETNDSPDEDEEFEDEGAEDEEPEDEEPEDDDPGSDEEVPPTAAVRPEQMYPTQEFIPSRFPYDMYDLTDNERNACEFITVAYHAFACCYAVNKLHYNVDKFKIFDNRLQLFLCRALRRFEHDVMRILPRLKDLGLQGLAELEQLHREDANPDPKSGLPFETSMPPYLLPHLPLDVEDHPALPMSWMTLDVVEPYECDNFKEKDERREPVFYLLALLKVMHEKLLAFEQTNLDPEQALYPGLAYQMEQALDDCVGHLGRVWSLCWTDAQTVLDEEEEWEQEKLQAIEAKRVAESRILVVGQDSPAVQISKIGTMVNGRHVGITLAVAQMLIACGLQGTGKSHAAALLRETVHLLLPGLGRMEAPGKTISFEVDFNKGHTRRCSLSGIYPNPYPAHRQKLKSIFDFDQVAAFPQIDVLVMPGQTARYRKEFQEVYGEEHERFNLMEMGFDPHEMGSQHYGLLLPIGTKGNGEVQTQGRALLDAIIGNLGLGRHPDVILAELKKAKFPGVNQAAFMAQFQLLRELTTPGQYMIDRLKGKNPLVSLMESKVLGPRRLLSVEVCIMAALSAVFRDGSDPLRLFILHELGKQALHEVVAPYLIECAAEVRHNTCSYFLETQQAGFLPKALVALCTGILQSKTTSQADYRILQDLFYAFQHVPFHEIANLLPGSAYVGFHHANDPQYRDRAFRTEYRPTATWAGGETRSAV